MKRSRFWHDASEVEAEWSEPAADVRTSFARQRAQIYAHAGDLDSALNDIGEAINFGGEVPWRLAAELRTNEVRLPAPSGQTP